MARNIPGNVVLGEGTAVRGGDCFNRFFSEQDPALRIGAHCLIENAHFALGTNAQMELGDECYLSSPIFLCEEKIVIGSRVIVGWNAAIMDTNFHPLNAELRIEDAIACSPLAKGRSRPHIETAAVVIGDDVWIGPQSTILKGTTIGSGSFIEPGSMVTQDVPPGSRVYGNPGRCEPIEDHE